MRRWVQRLSRFIQWAWVTLSIMCVLFLMLWLALDVFFTWVLSRT